MVVGPDVQAEHVRRVEREGVSLLKCPMKQGRIDLEALLDLLGGMDMTSILVEGGPAIMGSLIGEELIDKFYIFKAPKILGGHDGMPMASGSGPQKMDAALKLNNIKVRRFGDDVLIEGEVEKKGHKAHGTGHKV
jgi:diaminohydroxyphosphoribosylaminopyrimidine deaminase/5-amino-6-(5-phosphoribosylamino)uracil reductase